MAVKPRNKYGFLHINIMYPASTFSSLEVMETYFLGFPLVLGMKLTGKTEFFFFKF